MQWWAWITVGAILLVGELAFIDAQFYLIFLGLSALSVGALVLGGVLGAEWLQWVTFAVLAAGSMIGFRRRIYERMRLKLPTMRHGPVGDTVTCPAELSSGDTCRLEYHGSTWSVLNGGQSAIAAGARARILRVEGVTLVVHADL